MPTHQPRHRRMATLTMLGSLIAFESLTPGFDLCFAPVGYRPDLAAAQAPAPLMAQAEPSTQSGPEPAPEPADQPEPLPPPTVDAVDVVGVVDVVSALAIVNAAPPSPEPAEPAEPPATVAAEPDSPPPSLYAAYPALRGLQPSGAPLPFITPASSAAETTPPVQAPEPDVLGLMAVALLALAARRRRT